MWAKNGGVSGHGVVDLFRLGRAGWHDMRRCDRRGSACRRRSKKKDDESQSQPRQGQRGTGVAGLEVVS